MLTLRRRPKTSYAASRRLDRLGARRIASAIELATDVVKVTPPSAPSFWLQRVDGRDQIANAIRTDGWRGFERPLPDVFLGLARRANGLIVDIGANTGFYSLLAVAAAGSGSAGVIAYEPNPSVADIFDRNLRLNATKGVELSRLALGASPGTAALHLPDPTHGLIETSASLNHSFRDEGTTSAVEVTVSTLDVEMAAPARQVGLVKIDVESTEYDVLLGGEMVVARDRPLIVLEVLPIADAGALDAYCTRHDYVDIRLRADDAIIGEPVQFDPDAWNHVWTPAERRDEVVAACRTSGLRA